MPGIAGCFGQGVDITTVSVALARLAHFSEYDFGSESFGSSGAMGQVWRDREHSARDWALNSLARVAVFVSGSILENGMTPKRLYAADILIRYLDGVLTPEDFEGAFLIAIVDSRRNRLILINDHMGASPVYYSCRDGRFYFAPEIKAIFPMSRAEPALSQAGIVTFLSCGYCFGSTTLFEGVHALEPGMRLEFDIYSGELFKRRYWNLTNGRSEELRSRVSAEGALYESLRQAHAISLCDDPADFTLMLTGGADSRGILAVLDDMKRPPRQAFSWGERSDLPGSDPYIAAALAERYGVPFRFLRYDAGQFIENVESWSYLSELATDNLGWYAEGASMLASDYRLCGQLALVGDENWGNNGFVNDRDSARAISFPAHLPGILEKRFSPGVLGGCRDIYETEVESIEKGCESNNPIDLRDYLYQYGRVARYILALGYYKELAVELRRPFLMKPVLDVVRHLPPRLRMEKNLYVSMLARFYPEVMRFPLRTADSLPQWKNELRRNREIHRYFLSRLDYRRLENGPLAGFFDEATLDELRSEISPAAAEPVRKKVRRSRIGKIIGPRMHSRCQAMKSVLRIRAPAWPGAIRHDFDLIRDLGLLVTLQESLQRFRADPQVDTVALSNQGRYG